MSITCRDDLIKCRDEVRKEIDSYTCRVLICCGTGCMASGAQKVYDEMVSLCADMEGVQIEMQTCLISV